MMFGALVGWMLIMNAFRSTKSDIEGNETLLVKLPERLKSTVILAIENLQWILQLLNLIWFLANQIALTAFITAEIRRSLH